MFEGRLGLETARVPHADRHGLLWLARGKLSVDRGNLVFATAGTNELEAGVYQIPFQTITSILLGPGSTVSHDALRLLARHQTGLLAVGDGGVRLYASMPFGPDRSDLARRQVELWSEDDKRIEVTRHMYALRFGELLPQRDINALRGIEGTRMKATYKRLAEQYGVEWKGRRYDQWKGPGKKDLEDDDKINHAINHASAAVRAAAMIAVAVTGTVPQLGFIHEASGVAFPLDVADLFRSNFMLPCAFEAVNLNERRNEKLERTTRRLVGKRLRQEKIVPEMIDSIKKLMEGRNVDDSRNHS